MIKPPRSIGRTWPFAGCFAFAGCGGIQSALDPAGPGAARIGDIWWLMLFVCTAVFIVVMAMLLWAVARRRRPALDAVSGTGAARC